MVAYIFYLNKKNTSTFAADTTLYIPRGRETFLITFQRNVKSQFAEGEVLIFKLVSF